MRIAYLGAVEFSRACLEAVIATGENVVAVFSLDPAKAKRHADYADLAPLARQHGIPVFPISEINAPATVEAMRAARPDVIFVFGWSQLIGPEIRSIAPCLGTHPALLPRNRGRHPIVWALALGLPESGLTFFYLDEGADSGDIVWQMPFAITDEDDAGTLLGKITQLAKAAIAEFVPQLAAGAAPRIPQDHSLANYWRKRTAVDGEIPWEQPARECFNLIRALTKPYPGAHTGLHGEQVTIWKSRLHTEKSEALSGTILRQTQDGWLVAAGSGETLELLAWSGPALEAGVRFSRLLPPLHS